jgi:NADPH-dependent curcumin reductase CurA
MSSGQNDRVNRQLILKRVPEGISGPEDFEVRESPAPEPGDGELLIEAHYLGVDAALRLITRDSDEFLFRVKPGDLVHGSMAGKVIESKHPDYQAGDYVEGSLGLQNFAVSDGAGLDRCDITQAPLGAWMGGFGVSGLTAWFAITEECRPQPGQTVLINGAAGAVGSMAGQICRLAGAKVIGLTSSDEKCRWLTDELGYDIAINYRDADWYQQLEAAAPDRLDVIFDNVGGDLLDQSLKLIGMHGVVLLCGSTSQYSEDEMQGPANYIWLGTMRARLQGFVIFDYADRYAEARAKMSRLIASGDLKIPSWEVEGDVDAFPAAYQQMYEGKNLGKTLVRLPAAED